MVPLALQPFAVEVESGKAGDQTQHQQGPDIADQIHIPGRIKALHTVEVIEKIHPLRFGGCDHTDCGKQGCDSDKV